MNKKLVIIILFLLIVGVLVAYLFIKDDNTAVDINTNNNINSSTTNKPILNKNINTNTQSVDESVVFTHDVFALNFIVFQ